MSAAEHVVVAIPTYRRVEMLAALLSDVQKQSAEVDSAVRIVVVDNDPDRSARAIATGAGADYVHEPRPGIAAARQTALAQAGPGELLAMLDDDVTPEPRWLDELISTWRRYRPTVVMGYVRYVWAEDTDPWIVAGGFMRREHRRTGTPLHALSTGNVLIDADAVRRLGVDFDPDLGLSGGEDSLFGTKVLDAGGDIVASGESVVRDTIPADRTTREFVRRRSIAHGEALVASQIRARRGLRALGARVAAIVGGVVRWVLFTGLHFAGRLTSSTPRSATAMRRAWFAQGRLRAALGRRTSEYARPAVSSGTGA